MWKNPNQTGCGKGKWKAPPHFEILRWNFFIKTIKK
jgi:hypothetical protein